MERYLPIIYLVGWLAIVFGVSYLINWLLVRSLIRRYYRFFVAPGVIVHELSHALGCVLTGAEIEEINFWKPTGGHVKHYQPKMGLLGEAIIALAPIWGTFTLLGLITWQLIPSASIFFQTADPAYLVRSLELTSWHTWVYLYLVTSLLATVAPSKTDMRYALASLAIIALVLIGLVSLPGFNDWLVNVGDFVKPFAIFTLILLAVALATAFLLALPYRRRHYVTREMIE